MSETNSRLQQSRRDVEELPARIASERAQLGSGGRYAYIDNQNLAKAQRDLEAAKALVPTAIASKFAGSPAASTRS